MEVEITGMEDLVAKLSNFKERLTSTVFDIIEDAAEMVVVDAQSIVPVKTGWLKKSIYVRVKDEGAGIVIVTAEAPYAGWVEYGSSKQRPQPYMQPSVAYAVKELSDEVKWSMEMLTK